MDIFGNIIFKKGGDYTFLKCVCSGSNGNQYILENENEVLLIEAGCNLKKTKIAINFNISKVVGCIISHEHG